MFNSLRGTVCEKKPGTLYLATGGVEWEIAMTKNDMDVLPDSGNEARVWVWLCHREDGMTLFGFASAEQRETFFALLKVEGIGPKGALKILGGISHAELLRALEAGDVSRLEAVPGLGKKTAQKMILALKGKIVQAEGGGKGTPGTEFPDIAGALTEMGYERRAVIAALERASSEAAPGTRDRESAIFRRAVLLLSGQNPGPS